MKICFATNNRHKIEEVAKMLGDAYELVGLADIGCSAELPENHDTLEGNSLEKAQYVWDNFGVSCFADDTGLEVEALGGAPGVYSARFAGPQRKDSDNIALLLEKLAAETNRKARFRTSITLILDGAVHQFDGIVQGEIGREPRGSNGFGYDPVFVPEGGARTFAEMTMAEKNTISHRARAVQQLVAFLREEV